MEANAILFWNTSSRFLITLLSPRGGFILVLGGGQEYRALTKKTTDKICLKDHEQAVHVRGRVGCSPTFSSCGDLHLTDMWL